jgi:hypothetical protein
MFWEIISCQQRKCTDINIVYKNKVKLIENSFLYFLTGNKIKLKK